MYCVEALGCLSVYIDTEVYVYMQVYSAIVLLALKKNQPVQRSRTTHCQVLTVNYQVSTVNFGVTLRAIEYKLLLNINL